MSNIPVSLPVLTPEVVALLNAALKNQQPAPESDATSTIQWSSSPGAPSTLASLDEFPVDPSLVNSVCPNREVERLREEVKSLNDELKALKRSLEDQAATRNGKKQKLSRPLNELSEDQKIAREDLVRQIRRTMKGLTGRSEDDIEGQEVMEPDFTHTAKESPNEEITQRVAELVTAECKNKETGKYEWEGHEFSFDDVCVFARRTFYGWKTEYETKRDQRKGKKKELNQRKNRHYARQLAVSHSRKAAKKMYETKHNCILLEEIFEPDYMTPYISELDSSEVSISEDDEDERETIIEEAKDKHYRRLAKKANIPATEQVTGAPVWEKQSKSFHSQKYNEIIWELDSISNTGRATKRGKGRARTLVPKIDLGNEDPCPPNGKLPVLPFMVDLQWREAYEAEGKGFDIAESDPEGFD